MALSAVMNWFGRADRAMAAAPLSLAEIEPPPLPFVPIAPGIRVPAPFWPAERLRAAAELWGEGFQAPGGDIEVLRLAKPLGLSSASSLLLVGAGGGGASCSIAQQLGVWVSGFEADAGLAAAATALIAQRKLTKRAAIEVWNPADPVFRKSFYHHCIALEPLRDAPVERTFAAIAQALKPGGQLMVSQIVADAPLDATDQAVAHWARLERRDSAMLPTEVAITRTLKRLGYDVRIVEDLSERHIHQALIGWRAAVRKMEDDRPSRRAAMAFVQEAELWLFKLRLFQLGKLRLVRWHGIGK